MANQNLTPLFEPTLSGTAPDQRTSVRTATPDLGLQPTLNPQQTPVDSYVYPGQPQRTTWGDLADSLQALEPTLNQYAQQQQVKLDKADFAKGQEAYLKSKAKLKDAVNQGLIPAGMSPAFKRGYQQSELRVLGLSYDEQLRDAYQKAGLDNSDDPNAMAKFSQDFTSKFIQDNAQGYDPLDVSDSLMPAIEGSQANLAQYHSARRAQLVEQGQFANTEVEIATSIDNALAQPGDVDHAKLGAMLTGQLNQALSNGGDAKAYNEMLVDQVVAKAKEQNDPSLLDVLDHVSTGPGGTLGKTTYAKEHALEAQDSITNHAMQIEAYNDRKVRETRQDQADAIFNQAVQAIQQNPAADVGAYMKAIGPLDAGKASSILSLQQAMLSTRSRVIEDPAVKATVYANVSAAQDKGEQIRIITAAAQNHMIDTNSVGDLMRYGDDQLKVKPTLDKPFYKDIEHDLLYAVKGAGDKLDGDQTVIALSRARRELEMVTKKWIKDHPQNGGAGDDEALELYLFDQSDKIASKYRKWIQSDPDTDGALLKITPGQADVPEPPEPAPVVQPAPQQQPSESLADKIENWFKGKPDNPFDATQQMQ